MENILEVKNLNVYYTDKGSLLHKKKEDKHALKNVSFTMQEGEILGLVGESGCGKTSLAKAILGMQKKFDGDVILKCDNPQMVFQDPYGSLNPSKKIGWILEEPLRMKHKYSAQERNDKVDEMLIKVGLDVKCREHYPNELSGGQRQRVAIAAALLCDTKFLIADEPVSALDVSIQSQVLNLLRQLQQSMGMAYIFISHNLSVIKHISDRVMVMYLGHVVELADKNDLFDHPSHPYTQALLSAIPVPERHSKRKKILLQGDLPSPANPPSGCIFHTRCFMAQEICSSQKPELKDVGNGHLCACHFCGGSCTENDKKEN